MKKYIFIIFYLFCFSITSYSQDQAKVDSLQKLLKTDISDTEKIDIWNHLVRLYYRSDSNQVFYYSDKSIPLGEKINYTKGLAQSYNGRGISYKHYGQYEKAFFNFQEVIRVSKKGKYEKGISLGYFGMARIYKEQGQYEKALEYYDKSLEIEQQLGDKQRIAVNYNNRSVIYQEMGNYPKALNYLFRSLEIVESFNNQKEIGICYNNIGNIYALQGDYEKALDYLQKALAIFQKIDNKGFGSETLFYIGDLYIKQNQYEKAEEYYLKAEEWVLTTGDKDNQGYVYHGLGEIYFVLKDYESSDRYLQKALALRQEMGRKRAVAETLVSLGKINFQIQDYSSATQYLEQGIQLAREIGVPDVLRDGLLILSKIQETVGDMQNSYKTYKEYILMKDSLSNIENTKKLLRLETENKLNKQKDSLQFIQEKERLFFEEENKRKFTIQIATFIGLGLVSLLVIVLAYFFWDKNKSNQKLRATNLKLEESYQEIQVSNEEIRSAHEEIRVINESLENTLMLVQEQKNNITASIHYAQKIQEAALPSEETFNAIFPEHFIIYEPRDLVSGDFYWLGDMRQEQGKIILAAIDCTGHGVPGAFMSMVANDLLNYIVNEKKITQADTILHLLHEEVRKVLKQEETQNQDGMDIALIVIDEQHQKLQFAGAKNPLIFIRNNQLEIIKGSRFSIGGDNFSQKVKFQSHEVSLHQPITCYLFSDGFQDQFGGPNGKKFRPSQMLKLFRKFHQEPLSYQKQLIEKTWQDWKGQEEQVDDVLLMAVHLRIAD